MSSSDVGEEEVELQGQIRALCIITRFIAKHALLLHSSVSSQQAAAVAVAAVAVSPAQQYQQ
jgi:hypothetical protein